MNIFKVLSNGGQRLKEQNVSSFLAYLLNPKESHGIEDSFLKKILHCLYTDANNPTQLDFLIEEEDRIKDLSIRSNFEFEVIPEQAFGNDDGNSIVDIVILCYVKSFQRNRTLVQNILEQNMTSELKQIFLIENKINEQAVDEAQLSNQVNHTIATLNRILNAEVNNINIEQMISYFFITPANLLNAQGAFQQLENERPNIPKTHISWFTDDKETKTIIKFLKSILRKESKGKIEPIYDYTKHTIKAFIAFVINDFRSRIDEELYARVPKTFYYNLNDLIVREAIEPNGVIQILQNFDSHIHNDHFAIHARYSRTHYISVFYDPLGDGYNGNKIFSIISQNSNWFRIEMVYRNLSPQLRVGIVEYSRRLENQYAIRDDNRSIQIRREEGEWTSNEIINIFSEMYNNIIHA